jgi:hypothetical protein
VHGMRRMLHVVAFSGSSCSFSCRRMPTRCPISEITSDAERYALDSSLLNPGCGILDAFRQRKIDVLLTKRENVEFVGKHEGGSEADEFPHSACFRNTNNCVAIYASHVSINAVSMTNHQE